MKRFVYLMKAMLLVAGIFILQSPSVYAAGSVYLSPSSSVLNQGSILAISIRGNSGSQSVNAASVQLSYPTAKFDYVSVSNSSAYSLSAATSGGGGTVRIDRGALPAVKGDQLIATLRLRAKTNSGSATVSITSASLISSSSNKNISPGKSGGTYTFRTAPVVVTKSEPPKDTKAPKISSVAVGGVAQNRAVISWTTSEPATSEVNFGLDKNYGLSAVSTKRVTNHKVTLNSAFLTPASEFHYMVRSVDASGNTAASDDATFKTKGLSLLITVVNQEGKKLNGASVEIGGQSAKTNKDGQATIDGLPVGVLPGVIAYQGDKQSVKITLVSGDIKTQPKPVTLSIETSPNYLIFIFPAALLLLIASFLAIRNNRLRGYISKIRLPKFRKLSIKPPASSTTDSAIETELSEPKVIAPGK